jgi:hypothetical protein
MYYHFNRRPTYHKSAAWCPRCQCRAGFEEKQNKPLQAYLGYLIQGVWNLFREIPPLPRVVCAILSISMLLVVSLLLNSLIQLVVPFMNIVYMILGILASAIAIYEFGKRQ